MVTTRILPWAAVLVLVIGAIVALSFGRRGDPPWPDDGGRAPAAVEPGTEPAVAPASVTVRGGLPASGKLEVDISSIQGEETGQRRVRSGWRLQDDGRVALPEPAEEDMIMPIEALAVPAPDGAVDISGDLPAPMRAALADGVRAMLALRQPLQAGERRVGERVSAGGDRYLITGATPGRLALSAEASSLPGAEGDETLIDLRDGEPVRIERHWTRPEGGMRVVTRVTLTR